MSVGFFWSMDWVGYPAGGIPAQIIYPQGFFGFVDFIGYPVAQRFPALLYQDPIYVHMGINSEFGPTYPHMALDSDFGDISLQLGSDAEFYGPRSRSP